ncbi:MAG: flagellar hook-basal body complex protein FliE [Deltaproteobacteria bacterium]|nr:flagellar hook-basal body complex protein FliE [Deltaproteobacteria bacterium]
MKLAPLSSNPLTRQMQELAQSGQNQPETTTGSSDANAAGTFVDTLEKAFTKVNRLQLEADRKIDAVTTGRSDDTLGAVVALQQAELSLQLLAQVRNKALKAYEEIIKMPV